MLKKVFIAAFSLGAVACARQDKLSIRPLATALAQGDRPVSFRVAEAAGQFALGNVALALESYRKALRQDPQSTDALVGRAACYDSFGRFDLSRRDYEAALALAPDDARLLSLFGSSLFRQGHGQEAAAVQREIAFRNNPSSGESQVTVQLPVARQASAETVALDPFKADLSPRSGAHLERLSLGEVALVTVPPSPAAFSVRKKSPATRDPSSLARSADLQPASLVPAGRSQPALRKFLILNAARSEGLAGRARQFLAGRGLGSALIGDAPRVFSRTVIIAPPSERARVLRLAKEFSVIPITRPGTRVILVLGRDAVPRLMQKS